MDRYLTLVIFFGLLAYTLLIDSHKAHKCGYVVTRLYGYAVTQLSGYEEIDYAVRYTITRLHKMSTFISWCQLNLKGCRLCG